MDWIGLLKVACDNTSLIGSTGNVRVDRILQGIVGIMEWVFPDRVRSYYVMGSYANGTAVSTSDIDMCPLFKTRDGFSESKEREMAWQIICFCDMICPAELGINPLDETQAESYSSTFKLESLLIYGDDIRDQMLLPPIDEYVRRCMSNYIHIRLRGSGQLVFPLDYPDPEGEFYGYDQREMSSLDGYRCKGTKDLIQMLIMQDARAMVAQKIRDYIPGKSAVYKLYGDFINDEWTGLLKEVWEKCRMQWEYRVPEGDTDRQRLRELCQGALAFENYYLTVYRDYWLRQLSNVDDGVKALAAQRLGSIVFPDKDVMWALRAYESYDGEQVRRAVRETIDRMQKIGKL